jgi:N-acetylmuramoyl-L-alanine amidase
MRPIIESGAPPFDFKGGELNTNSKAPPLSAKGGAPRAVIYLRDRERCAFVATLPRAANINPAGLTLREDTQGKRPPLQRPTVNPVPYAHLSELELLALCVWREARGEGLLGKRGVAHVIQNRAAHPRWWGGPSLHSVILKPWQFSSFNPGDANAEKWPGDCNPWFVDCEEICQAVLRGADEDITGGATSYHDISIPPPAWATDGSNELTLAVGRLKFYRLAPALRVTDVELGM